MPACASGAVSCVVSRMSVASTPHAAPVRRACISRCSSANRLRACSGLTEPTPPAPPRAFRGAASPGMVCQRREGHLRTSAGHVHRVNTAHVPCSAALRWSAPARDRPIVLGATLRRCYP
jgi:hypothetical protein